MSKGLGRVGRAIEAALIAEPDNAFTVDDLCDRVFPGIDRVQKKHRVSVIRAAKSVAKRHANFESVRSEMLGGTTVFYVADNVMSSAMGRLKSDNLHGYRNSHPNPRWVSDTEQELQARLIEGGKDHRHVVAGGCYWRQVEEWKAKRSGDTETVQRLQAESDREMEELLALMPRR
jgi:hypothetical protein